MRFKENIKDFLAVVREYKKFFVPRYCSTPTFYLFLIIMLILPRKLFNLPNERGDKQDEKLSEYLLESLSENDKELLKETLNEYYKDDAKCAISDR